MTTEGVMQGDQDFATDWIPDDGNFGARLALVRQRMGWGNVKEAADACGVPVASWRNWERDGRLPRRPEAVVGQIAARAGCDYVWLLAGRRGVRRSHDPLTPARQVHRTDRPTPMRPPTNTSTRRPARLLPVAVQ
jgi:hypothetical protein